MDGTRDERVPVADAHRLAAAAPSAELLALPGAGHDSLEPFLDAAPRLRAFLERALAAGPPSGLLAEAVSADGMLHAMKHEGGEPLRASRDHVERVARLGRYFPKDIQNAKRDPQRHSEWTLGSEQY